MAAFCCKVVLLIAGFGSCVQSATHNYRPLRYTIPRPLIQAFSPQGLEVSIPHTPGIQLFAFHGSINKFLDGTEIGDMRKHVLERDGERWAYKNSTVKLRLGDKIYYRLYVVKDNLGYRLQHGMFEVKDFSLPDKESSAPEEAVPAPTPQPPTLCSRTGSICEKVVLNLTQRVCDLQQEIDSLRETNDILKDMVKKHPTTSTTLALDGVKVQDDELGVIVQAIIEDKLGLPFKVDNIQRKRNGLVQFEVESLEKKLEIIRVAKTKLRHSNFRLVY